jgi:aldehyde dehydrogenase (NAD+)
MIGRVPLACPADVDKAVSAAREAFGEGQGPRPPLDERLRLLVRLAEP